MAVKRIIFIGFLVVLCGSIVLFIHKEITVLWNSNSVVIQTEAPLQKDKVVVKYGLARNLGSNRASLSNTTKYQLIFDKIHKKKIPNHYGENEFFISYGNQYYLFFRHFKTNWRHQHNYIFYFYQKNDQLYVKVTIEGVDDRSFESEMKMIKKEAV